MGSWSRPRNCWPRPAREKQVLTLGAGVKTALCRRVAGDAVAVVGR